MAFCYTTSVHLSRNILIISLAHRVTTVPSLPGRLLQELSSACLGTLGENRQHRVTLSAVCPKVPGALLTHLSHWNPWAPLNRSHMNTSVGRPLAFPLPCWDPESAGPGRCLLVSQNVTPRFRLD